LFLLKTEARDSYKLCTTGEVPPNAYHGTR